MAEALSQPHVVASILPNQWTLIHADIVVENKGTGTAYDIQVAFDPPLENGPARKDRPIPLQHISLLKPNQEMRSYLTDFAPLLDQTYNVTVSWKRSPTATARETLTYNLDMSEFKGITQLGASEPSVQIAEQLKKLREDWRSIAGGSRKLLIDTHNSTDRQREERELERRFAAQRKTQSIKKPTSPRKPRNKKGNGE
jgi:hypothetical protein